MAGINKDERQFVINSFISKCHEVGIKLCYTNEVLDEIYRVINGQVNYIKMITQGQAPLSNKVLAKINDSSDVNDFYTIYYNWCKKPQNKYNDYIGFRSYLLRLVLKATETFDVLQIPNYQASEAKKFSILFDDLMKYKSEKRPYRTVSDSSVKTDINNILFIESLRSKDSNSIWQINDYFVSADQILTNWAKNEFSGMPTVMIPSIWLSIILKVSGRTSDDDYKSYCMFLTLRQHHFEDQEIEIDPIILLNKLSEKTIDTEIKEKIIDEILSNKDNYIFLSENEYDTSVQKAFDVVLLKEREKNINDLEEAVKKQKSEFQCEKEDYESKLQNRKTKEEYAKEFAENKSKKKIDKYAKHENVRLILWGFILISLIIIVLSYLFKLYPIYNLLFASKEDSGYIWTIISWLFSVIVDSVLVYFAAIWKYLGSPERKAKLYSRYLKEQLENLEY